MSDCVSKEEKGESTGRVGEGLARDALRGFPLDILCF